VSVYPCSDCRQRKPGKLASAYWAWFNPEGDRRAFKCRYCPGCAQTSLHDLLLALHQQDGNENVFACLLCGSDAHSDSDPMYLTLYLPGKEPMEYALQLDSACAVKLRAEVMKIGDPLADRGGLVRGPSPSVSAWDALGLSPN
jgi:hypothetical protein